jgi:DNA-3-methyladenine glycosylase
MNFVPLSRDFFLPTADRVARSLLGHWLLRRTPEGMAGGPIVETEAYLEGDPASHGYAGLTARNRSMYGPPGHAYVYLIYGFYCCVNAACRPEGCAEAVLIRAIEPFFDLTWMEKNRPAREPVQLTNGPGKLCTALSIDRSLDSVNLCQPDSPLIIAQNPDIETFRKERGPVAATQRIGITRAADLKLRFCLQASPSLSKKLGGPKRRHTS